MTSLGQRPRNRENKENAAALKVRFTSYIKFDPSGPAETRFQRFFLV
jgi:hypothetical protein